MLQPIHEDLVEIRGVGYAQLNGPNYVQYNQRAD